MSFETSSGQSNQVTFTVTKDSTASSIVISPSSGYRPLQATLTLTTQSAGTYTVYFGDGTSEQVTVPQIYCFAYPCNLPPQSVGHTYWNSGTYTASAAGIGSATVTVY